MQIPGSVVKENKPVRLDITSPVKRYADKTENITQMTYPAHKAIVSLDKNYLTTEDTGPNNGHGEYMKFEKDDKGRLTIMSGYEMYLTCKKDGEVDWVRKKSEMIKFTPKKSPYQGFALKGPNGKYLSFEDGNVECSFMEIGEGQTFNFDEVFKKV